MYLDVTIYIFTNVHEIYISINLKLSCYHLLGLQYHTETIGFKLNRQLNPLNGSVHIYGLKR